MKRLLSTLIFVLITINCWAAESYTLGRAPQLSPKIISETWSPLVKYLSQQTGKNILLKIYQSRDDFELDIEQGKLDFYFGNPGYAVVGHERFGYTPLIRSNKHPAFGVLVTSKDSHITRLQQLSGKTLAFPSENAFAASKYLRAQLKKHEKLDFKAEYIGTHDNVYRSVVIGQFPAGGGVERTLEREPVRLKSHLRILYRTPDLAPHPLMAHPRVPLALQQAVQKAILDLTKTMQGRQMLKSVKLEKPVIPDYQKDYAPLGELVHNMYAELYK